MRTNLSNKRNENGITLVALVVTIVVLLILAGVSIVTLFGENGIITVAQKAADETKKGIDKDIKDIGNLENDMNKALGGDEDNDKWQEVKNPKGQVKKVKKGKIELDIGDYINYDCTKDASGAVVTAGYTSKKYNSTNPNQLSSGYEKHQTFYAKDYTGKWRVLGAENGKLLIMSAENVPLIEEGSTGSTKKFNVGNTPDQAKASYKYAVTELNNISAIYGKGDFATGARSIKVEDVNKITGYNPEDNKDEKDNIGEYENGVTYYWDGTDKPYYEYKTESGEKKTGKLSSSHSKGFIWFENGEWNISNKPSNLTTQVTDVSQMIKINENLIVNTGYLYYPETLTQIKDVTATRGISHEDEKYKMLFSEIRDGYYWFASPFIKNYQSYCEAGLQTSYCGYVCPQSIVESYNKGNEVGFGVRPVVYLSSDIKLKEGTPVGDVKSWDIE